MIKTIDCEATMAKMHLNEVINRMGLKVLSGEREAEETWIRVYGVNRAGLELSGFFQSSQNPNSHRLVLLSSKENHYIHQYKSQDREVRYRKLIKSGIPAIVITTKFKDPLLIKVAQELKFPLLQTDAQSTHNFTHNLVELMDDFFSIKDEIHGTLVNVYGKGILLIGKSGIGKSEIALDLIKNNHLFVGDDRIVIHKKNNRLYGRSNPILRNLIEVRGIGIIDIALASGYQIILNESEINLIIELFAFRTSRVDTTDRLGIEYRKKQLLGVDVPFLQIPVSSGRSIANIVETAVTQLKIRTEIDPVNPVELIHQRLNEKNIRDKE